MGEMLLGFSIGAVVVGWMAWLWVAELRRVIRAFVDSEVEYMTVNNLGDPEKQHNVKWARRVLGDNR